MRLKDALQCQFVAGSLWKAVPALFDKAVGRWDHAGALRPASRMLQAGLNSVIVNDGTGGTDVAVFEPAVVLSIPLLPPLECGPSRSASCALEAARIPLLPDTDIPRTFCSQVHSLGVRKNVQIQSAGASFARLDARRSSLLWHSQIRVQERSLELVKQ